MSDPELPPPPPSAFDLPVENLSSNAGRNSAAEQGVEIPSAWKQSIREPVPVVRCTAKSSTSGERCKRWSLRGTTVCTSHGAQLPNVRDHSEAVVESARMRLMGLADVAVDGLEDLLTSATMANVRLGAIKEVLDRAGIKGSPDLTVEVNHNVSYKDEIQKKLQNIREAKEKMAAGTVEEDIVDAEIVPAVDNDTDELSS